MGPKGGSQQIHMRGLRHAPGEFCQSLTLDGKGASHGLHLKEPPLLGLRPLLHEDVSFKTSHE